MYDEAEIRKHREVFFPANGRNSHPLGRGRMLKTQKNTEANPIKSYNLNYLGDFT